MSERESDAPQQPPPPWRTATVMRSRAPGANLNKCRLLMQSEWCSRPLFALTRCCCCLPADLHKHRHTLALCVLCDANTRRTYGVSERTAPKAMSIDDANLALHTEKWADCRGLNCHLRRSASCFMRKMAFLWWQLPKPVGMRTALLSLRVHNRNTLFYTQWKSHFVAF